MTDRDPREDPLPGDEFTSPGRLKAKVVSITIEETGITKVCYVVGRCGEDYWDTVVSRSLKGWQYFIKDAPEVTPAKEQTPAPAPPEGAAR
jgi:hypothetical protein